MVAKEDREFDIIIFGATGYTGIYVIEELAYSTVSNNLKWAIAGRNVEKLKESLIIAQKYIGSTKDVNLEGTPIIEADVKNALSLSNMCKKTKLILNCVGPYKLYGEPVVAACIENGTHHVDISGELRYLETVQAKYFDAAQAKKVYIVQACGLDSIPGDYGISLLKNRFPGDLNSVEYYVKVGVGPEGRTTNIGTFLSAIHSARDTLNTKDLDNLLKEKVFKKDLPQSRFPLSWRLPPLFYSPEVKGWCFWFLGPDERVIKRSQMFRYEYLNERPIQSCGYFQVSSFFMALFYLFLAGVFGFFSLFSFGRNLLAKYPSFFTAGIFSNEGPTRKQVLEGTTTITLYGEGWKEKLSDPTDQHTKKPDTKIKLTITGPEPVYNLTSTCMVQAGLTIIEECSKMPLEGGVFTPGVAFEKTSLQSRLEERGLNFKFETVKCVLYMFDDH